MRIARMHCQPFWLEKGAATDSKKFTGLALLPVHGLNVKVENAFSFILLGAALTGESYCQLCAQALKRQHDQADGELAGAL